MGNEPPSVRDILHFFVSGAHLDAVDAGGQTLVHLLVQHADSLVSLEFVCRNGAAPNAVDKNGVTALSLAQRVGATKAAACLKRHCSATTPVPTITSPSSTPSKPSAGSRIKQSEQLSRSSHNDASAPSSAEDSSSRRQRTWTSTKPREAVVWLPASSPSLRRESGVAPAASEPVEQRDSPSSAGSTSPRLRTAAVPSTAVAAVAHPKKPLPSAPKLSLPQPSPSGPPPLPPERGLVSPGRHKPLPRLDSSGDGDDD